MSHVLELDFNRLAPAPDVAEMVARASDILPMAWPLQSFVASNPLCGLENLPFEAALQRVGQWAVPEPVNRETIKWCAAFLDTGQATIRMPSRHLGFYGAFRDLAPYDKSLRPLPKLPAAAPEAILDALQRLRIPPSQWEDFIRQMLGSLPGWAAAMRARGQLVEHVAVRLAITRARWPDASVLPMQQKTYAIPDRDAETRYRDALLASLHRKAGPEKPHAQWVFCIDARSERLRRRIEASGNFETFGAAGFFGLPITWQGRPACPPIIEPTAHVAGHERKAPWLKLQDAIYEALKYNAATPFALVEMLGAWCGLKLLGLRWPRDKRAADPILDTIPLDEQIAWAQNALRTIGIADHLAPTVVLCGHGSTTTNNPYASALHCGACGGQRGGANARILTAILNDPRVRERLSIPSETRFVAAEHDTATDEITFFDDGNLLPNVVDRAARKRSRDWAEVRPEWGLARNAAFIIGPRELTRDVDLDGRCFLHSYDAERDPDGSVLEAILSGPVVVGQWINNQYLFSTLDNATFGSGSKVTQNITGKHGVMQGNASDLLHGLPLQSVNATDDDAYHEPLRLLVVICAPAEQVSAVLQRVPAVQKLFDNGWMHLAVVSATAARSADPASAT